MKLHCSFNNWWSRWSKVLQRPESNATHFFSHSQLILLKLQICHIITWIFGLTPLRCDSLCASAVPLCRSLSQPPLYFGNDLVLKPLSANFIFKGKLWKSWRSVSGGLVPIKMWQKCFFTTAMRGHTQVCVPERPSQSFSGLSCLIHLIALIWLLLTTIFSVPWKLQSADRGLRTTRKSLLK
jgi:hypothetical protein